MKTKQYLFFILLTLLGSCHSMAQTPIISSKEYYYNAQGLTVLACIDPNNTNNEVVCYMDKNTTNPYFFYQQQSSSSIRRYYLILPINNQQIVYTYSVADMKIIGQYCYFCGSKIGTLHDESSDPNLLRIGNSISEEGFIGRFLLSEIAYSNTASLNMEIRCIPGTTEFSKMEGTQWGPNSNMLCLIGTTDVNHTISCLVTIEDFQYSFNYDLYSLPNSSETLTDITIVPDYVVTSSLFISDQFRFGLRLIENNHMFTSNVQTDFGTSYQYNTTGINTQTPPRPSTPTKLSGKLLLSRISSYNEIGIAYDSEGGAFDSQCFTDMYHTALFRMDLVSLLCNYPEMIQAMLLTRYCKEKEPLVDFRCDTYYQMILLHNNANTQSEATTCVQFPLWNTIGPVNSLYSFSTVSTSMDWHTNRLVHVGYNQQDNGLFHFEQDLSNVNSSCYSAAPKAILEEMNVVSPTTQTSSISKISSTLQWVSIDNTFSDSYRNNTCASK